MKCKVINASKTQLESDVNNWLDLDKFEIFKILQTQNESYITLTIFYFDLKEIRAKKLNKLKKL